MVELALDAPTRQTAHPCDQLPHPMGLHLGVSPLLPGEVGAPQLHLVNVEGGARRRVPPVRLPGGAGSRPRPFPAGCEIPALNLLEAKTFRSSVTLARYAPA